MSQIGSGVEEIRVHVGDEYRVLYVAKFEEGVYVLHAFEKKSQRTAQRDKDLAERRYRAVIKERKKREKTS